MEQTYQISGTVERFLFQNSENGYAVFLLQSPAHHTAIVARGYMANLQVGQEVQIKGAWATHPKFGKQFEISVCIAQIPTTLTGIKKYLGSGLIKGIGPAFAEKLVDFFGEQVLKVIDKEPYKLAQVSGVGPKRIEMIVHAWQDQKEISSIMIFLQEKGVSPAYATKIYRAYGQNAVATVQENPYRLCEDIWGIGFKTADEIATNIGIARNSLKRVKAGLMHAISTHVGNGHLYVELTALKANTVELLALEEHESESLLKMALHDLYNDEKIKLITHEKLHYVTLKQYYFSEKGVAQKILKRCH